MPDPETHALFATAPKGLAALLATELRSLGASAVDAQRGGVRFRGSLEVAYRACLWSRIANRVLLPLARFGAATPECLYAAAREVGWEDHLAVSGTLAVDFTTARSRIRHTRFGAQKVKDAVVDRFRDRLGARPSVQRVCPDIRINVHVDSDQAVLSLDLSGESLHKRGYRGESGAAPLKENLAAAMLAHARWPALADRGAPFLDPMCGSGTLPIEAALAAGDVAPGLAREHFGFLAWRGHDAALWRRLLAEAQERRARGLRTLPPVVGYDTDRLAVRRARDNARRAGLSEHVAFEQRSFADAGPPPSGQTESGLMACNPPYGERLGDSTRLEALRDEAAEILPERFPRWHVVLLTPANGPACVAGLRPGRALAVYNGPLDCRITRCRVSADGAGPRTKSAAGQRHPAPRSPDAAPMLANRLRKNLRRLGRWARREGVSCYRLYDADMPEYAFAVDIYEASGERWVVAQEYEPPADVDAGRAAERRGGALSALCDVLAVPRERIVLKTRRRHRNRSQYERLSREGGLLEVREDDCRLLVNLRERIDTGLFLDHRSTRRLLRGLVPGRRFLNLFAYTGAATVHAALAGAATTTSIDLSATNLGWLRRNLALNGIGGVHHRVVRADCLRWLREAPPEHFDVVFADVPTYSASKRTSTRFDAQRDHVTLIEAVMARVAEDGVLVFATHRRGFRLDEGALERYVLEDITAQTTPEDFARGRVARSCWRIRHRP